MKKSMDWLRLYHSIIDDEKIRLLAYEDRWHYVALLCMKRSGLLDSDCSHELLLRKVGVKSGLTEVELESVAKRLSDVGLIDRKTLQPTGWDKRQYESDSSTERVRRHRDKKKEGECNDVKRYTNVSVTPPETDTETDTEEKPTSAAPRRDALRCPHQKIVDAYNDALPELPQVKLLTPAREKAIKSRWVEVLKAGKYADEANGVQWWAGFFAYVAKSDFLTGRTGTFTASFDWLMKPANFAKVIEGNYRNKAAA